MEQLLTKLGLSKSESEIYLYVLTYGAQGVSAIARGTDLHRPVVYKSLERLKEYGLIATSPKGKRQHYSAAAPAKLLDIAESITHDVSDALPELEEQYAKKSSKPILQFFESKKGIGMIFHDIVNSLGKGDVFYRYSSAHDQQHSSSFVPRGYREKRDQKKLERFVITNKKAGSTKKPRLERAMKYFSDEVKFNQDVIQFIYGDKISFIDLNTETGWIMQSSELAEFQKTLFKELYSKL